jgi:hypothetical protein
MLILLQEYSGDPRTLGVFHTRPEDANDSDEFLRFLSTFGGFVLNVPDPEKMNRILKSIHVYHLIEGAEDQRRGAREAASFYDASDEEIIPPLPSDQGEDREAQGQAGRPAAYQAPEVQGQSCLRRPEEALTGGGGPGGEVSVSGGRERLTCGGNYAEKQDRQGPSGRSRGRRRRVPAFRESSRITAGPTTRTIWTPCSPRSTLRTSEGSAVRWASRSR